MNCKDFEQHIADYIQNVVPVDLKHDLDTHRENCPACAKLVSMQRLLNNSLNNAKSVEAPSGFAERMLQAVASEPGNVIEFNPSQLKRSDKSVFPAIDCKTFENNAAALVDGVLEDDFASRMDSHREDCITCDRLTTVHRMIATALNSAEAVTAPAHVTHNILEDIAVERVEKVRFFSLTKLSIYATASAAAGLVAAAMTSFTSGAAKFLPQEGLATTAFETAEASFASMGGRLFGWIVKNLPGELTSALPKLAEPMQLPFMESAIPPYMILVMGALTVYLATYFLNSDTYEVNA